MVGRGPQYLLLSLPAAAPVGAAAAAAGGPSAPRAGRPWRVLYGGPLRTPGGLGVSRHQKAVTGSGLRFEINSLVCIQQLKDTQHYVGENKYYFLLLLLVLLLLLLLELVLLLLLPLLLLLLLLLLL